ncbi:MAG: penicillin-binding protein 2 [Gammaproteobacteria bacterium]|nr:penicillin-binding protein 2 [Gammaproteobacteria bacterium]
MSQLTQIKDHWSEQRMFVRRVIVCVFLVLGLTGLVVTRLVQLQLVNFEYYSAQSQGNRIRVQPLPPTRGLIFDRNGKILAENLPTYQLELTPEQVPDVDDTLRRLAEAGLIDAENLPRLGDLILSHRRFDSIPLRQRLSDTEVARFAVQRPYFPGVEIRARLTRNYPYGPIAAHALGYVSGISAADKKILDPAGYAGTSHIGKVSVERAYEAQLHGEVGHEDVLVNAHGRNMQVLDAESSVPGRDLLLTLDIEAQIVAEQALDGRRGAVVGIVPSSGEILVFASAPSFNPNAFSGGLTPSQFQALQEDSNQPLFNRALSGQYPPGSTIKPMLALAALEQGTLDPATRIICRGFYTLPGRSHRYRDWKPEGHGSVDLHVAITESCDTYFYGVANNLGIEAIGRSLRNFGLGSPTGIDMPGESRGLVPSREWKRSEFANPADQVWFPGETVITGIGQGYLLATPLQLAHAVATIATRGKRYQPSMVRGLRDPVTGATEFRQPKLLASDDLTTETSWQLIIDSMVAVMQGPKGTARASGYGSAYSIAGKTGTAQVFSLGPDEEYDEEEIDESKRDHALFIAFAPVENPAIAVAVVVENGGSGSSVAAPIGRQILDTFLGSRPL